MRAIRPAVRTGWAADCVAKTGMGDGDLAGPAPIVVPEGVRACRTDGSWRLYDARQANPREYRTMCAMMRRALDHMNE